METAASYLLVMLFIVAAVLVAYEMGQSTEPSACPACPHCRDRRLDRERQASAAAVGQERIQSALYRLAMPSRDAVIAAPVPATTRRRAYDTAGGPALRKILVGYDGGEAARRALELALTLASGLGASLAVVSVVPLHPGRTPIDPLDDREVHAQELLEAKELAARRGVTVELVEPVGEPAQKILQAAEVGNFDAVVVGSPRSSTWLRILRGSVPAHVVSHGAKTVIVVH